MEQIMLVKDLRTWDERGKIDLRRLEEITGLTGEEKIVGATSIKNSGYIHIYEYTLEDGSFLEFATAGTSCIDYDRLKFKPKNYKKEYAAKIKILSNKYNISFKLALSLGEVEERYVALKNLVPFKVTKEEQHVLQNCGRDRRIKVLLSKLGEDIRGLDIKYSSQICSMRLAEFILKNQSK